MPGQTKASVTKWPCDTPLFWDTTKWWVVDCIWNVIAHAQKPRFVFRQNGQVHLNWRGHQFCRLVAAEVCASAVVMLDTPCTEVVWRVLAIHSIRQFPLHFSSRVSPCAIIFQLDSNSLLTFSDNLSVPSSSVKMCKAENREQLKFTDTVLFFGMLVHHLIFWKKRNISEVGPVSIFTHSTLLYEPLTLISFLIFCWPCISIYLFINIHQLDALNFIITLCQASTCFEHMCSLSGGQNCIIQSLVSSHL
jgi:hypothetical protein